MSSSLSMDNRLMHDLLEAAVDNDNGRVRVIITELGLAKLDDEAKSGELGSTIKEQGLTQLLHHAARNGHTDLLEIVLKDPKTNVNAQQELGCTALILACRYGHTSIVSLLLQKGAKVLMCSNDGLSCLHVAAFCGHTGVVNRLLHGNSPGTCWGSTKDPLKGRLALIRMKSHTEMFTALHMATSGGHDQREGQFAPFSVPEELSPSLDPQDHDESPEEIDPEPEDHDQGVGIAVSILEAMTTAEEIVPSLEPQDHDESPEESDPSLDPQDHDESPEEIDPEPEDHDQGIGIAVSILEAMTTSLFQNYKLGPGEKLKERFGIHEELWVDFLFHIHRALHGQVGDISERVILYKMLTYGNCGIGSALRKKLAGRYETLVQSFVEIVLYVNAKDVFGRTALHHAASKKKAKLVRFLMWDSELAGGRDSSLLGCVVNVNVADFDGYTPLHLAAKNNGQTVVKELLRGTVFNTREMEANKIAALYMEANASVDFLISSDRALAAKDLKTKKMAEIVSTIKNRNTRQTENIDLRFAKEDCLQPNALANPTGRHQEILSKVQRNLGKQVDRRNERPMLLPRPTMEDDIWQEDRASITPLHYAVENEHHAVVLLLMLHPKTDPFLCTSTTDRQSPWTIAFPLCWKLPETEFTATQKSLRADRAMADTLDAFGFRDKDEKFLPLEYQKLLGRVRHEDELLLRSHHKLLKQAVALATRQNDSESADDLRVLERQIVLACASLLVRHGVYANNIDSAKRDILWDAAQDVDLEDWNFTLLHVASYYGYGQEIKELLKLDRYKELVNERETFTRRGQTALHFATDGSAGAVAVLLKEELQDLTQTSKERLTPLGFIEKKLLDVSLKNNSKYEKLYKETLPTAKRLLMQHPTLQTNLYRDRQVYVDAANAILVGAALIASVTFAGFLQPPLGWVAYDDAYFPDPAPPSTQASFAAVGQYESIRAFWAFNSLSFFSAIATVLVGAGSALPLSGVSIETEVRTVRRWLIATAFLLAVSIVCVLGAFTAAGFASLPNILKYERNIIATATTGLALCLTVLSAFYYRLYLTLDASRQPRIFIDAVVVSFAKLILLIFLLLLYPFVYNDYLLKGDMERMASFWEVVGKVWDVGFF